MAAVVRRIDEYLETAPESHPDDFTITSGKNDTDAEEVNLYIMRTSSVGGSTGAEYYDRRTTGSRSTLPSPLFQTTCRFRQTLS